LVFFIDTLGCKVNQFESGSVAELLKNQGHEETRNASRADLIIVNTCAVTGEAGRKSAQTARKYKRDFPEAALAVCGCSSQISGDWARESGANIVFGTGDKSGFVLRINEYFSSRHDKPVVEIRRDTNYEILPVSGGHGRTRAQLKIEDGCDNYCSYCIVPFARGHVRSMPLSEIADAAAVLSREYKEIVITGIEISSYGYDLGNVTLIDAITVISNAAPESRLRLSSLEPSIVTADFVRRLRNIPNLCGHFHLSLQSGCDKTLRDMKRKYDTETFFSSIELLRENFDNCGITADIITGFPGETAECFDETAEFVRKCAFSGAHVFPYSERPGTLAAKMGGQVPKAERIRRAKIIRSIADESADAFRLAQIGKTLEVLFETEKNGITYGHSSNYLDVRSEASDLRGKIQKVLIGGADRGGLTGKII